MLEPLSLVSLRFVEAVTRVPVATRLGQRPASDYVRAPDEAEALFRLGIYQSMHESRLHDVLAEDFPRIRAILGDEVFAAVVRGYLRAHPSRSHRLSELGASLPAFLVAHPLAAHRPDLEDIARLDAARNAVFDAADDIPLRFADLASLFAAGSGRVRRIGASALLDATWAIEAAWVAADHRREAPPAAKGGATFLVWRRGHVVHHRRTDTREYAALVALEHGLELADLCALLAPEEPDAAVIFDILSGWAADELLCCVDEAR